MPTTTAPDLVPEAVPDLAPGTVPDLAPGLGVVRPLFALTDEELAVLAGTDEGPVAMPHLDALEGELRSVALHTAYRSMLASGLVTLPASAGGPLPAAARRAPEGEGRWFPVELPREVDAVLVLRGAAPVLLCLHRRTSGDVGGAARGGSGDVGGAARGDTGEEVLRYIHLVEDVALVEDVLATGLHRFGRVPRAQLGACVQQFLVPDDALAGQDTMVVDLTGFGGVPEEVERRLARVTVNADVTVRHEGDDGPGELLGLFLGPDGSWLSSNRFGVGGPVALEPLDPATVGERAVALVTVAEQEVGRGGGECVTMSR